MDSADSGGRYDNASNFLLFIGFHVWTTPQTKISNQGFKSNYESYIINQLHLTFMQQEILDPLEPVFDLFNSNPEEKDSFDGKYFWGDPVMNVEESTPVDI